MTELNHSEQDAPGKIQHGRTSPDFIQEVLDAQKIISTSESIFSVPPSTRQAIENGLLPSAEIDGSGRVHSAISEAASSATASLVTDMSERTLASFNDAVTKEKALGKQYEPALELQMKDWCDTFTYMDEHNMSADPVNSLRAKAIMADALGEAKLENGVRLSPSDHGARILQGYNYDFGGEATQFLRMSIDSLVKAENEVALNKGTIIDGTKMDDAYSAQLKMIQTNVEKQLDTIYGAHDIPAVYASLKSLAPHHNIELEESVVRLSQQLKVTKSLDPNYLAKQYRDLALGEFVIASDRADYKDYSTAETSYSEAAKNLQKSVDLVGAEAADNVGLTKIKDEVGMSIPVVVDHILGEFNTNQKK